jgi:predicted small secreted protein
MFKKRSSLIALFLGFLVLGALPACNSVRGAGEDIESAGEAIADTAQETEDEMND